MGVIVPGMTETTSSQPGAAAAGDADSGRPAPPAATAYATTSPASLPGPIATSPIGRSMKLLRACRQEQSDPAGFYSLLAADSVHQLSHYTRLDGATVLDVGGGPGYFRSAFREVGARYLWVEPDIDEMSAGGIVEPGRVLGSALDLPFQTGALDVCYSSNVLEHVGDPWRMGGEMIRVTRPGGIVFLSFTNWLSPWGGHETSPWHYLGGTRAAARYTRRTGKPPKNYFGRSLFAVSVADALAWANGRQDVAVLDAMPRYLPEWSRVMLRVPGVREVLTWNLALVMQKL
jgi:SAM-dependent methyltransferase